MIQRIQSVWLFLAAMINGLLFILKLYHFDKAGVMVHEGARDSAILFILAAVITALPLITIFFFGDRKRQKGFVWLSVLFCISFVAVAVTTVTNMTNKVPPVDVKYDFGLLVPVVSIVFLFMALGGIRKDEKLIKSLDRLR